MDSISSDEYLKHMMESFPRPAPALVRPYLVKNRKPLPKDFKYHLAIDMNKKTRMIGAGGYSMFGSPYILPFSADIVIMDEEGNIEKKIGFIVAKAVLSALMLNEGADLSENYDADSDELATMYKELFAEGCKLSDEFSQESQGDILYIEGVFLEPKYRGYGISLLALDAFHKSFPSFQMDNVILSPFLLASETTNMDQVQIKTANDALEKHWGYLGFKVWSKPGAKTKLMGLWTGYQIPSPRDIVPHLF